MKKEKIHTTGETFLDGTILEMVHDPMKNQTKLVLSNDQKITLFDQHKVGDKTYLPYSESNRLIKNRIVLLPSQAAEYGSMAQLINDLQSYIHRYVDLDNHKPPPMLEASKVKLRAYPFLTTQETTYDHTIRWNRLTQQQRDDFFNR